MFDKTSKLKIVISQAKGGFAIVDIRTDAVLKVGTYEEMTKSKEFLDKHNYGFEIFPKHNFHIDIINIH